MFDTFRVRSTAGVAFYTACSLKERINEQSLD